MFSPPPGYADCEADAEIDIERRDGGRYHDIDIAGVGVLHARRPMPRAIPVLAGVVNAKTTEEARRDQLDRFIQNHLKPGEFESLLARMMDPDDDMPADTMVRVSRAIATAGTARPT